MILTGRYAEALRECPETVPALAETRKEAATLSVAARSAARHAGRLRILQVVHVPKTDQWVAAMTSRPLNANDREESTDDFYVRGFSLEPGRFRWLGPRFHIESYHVARETVSLRLVRLSKGGAGYAAMAIHHIPYADMDGNDLDFFPLFNGGLRKGLTLHSIDTLKVVDANADHGLLAMVTPTWKVYWPDTYEWENRRFTLANRYHPELYEGIGKGWRRRDEIKSYGAWMTFASLSDIRGRFDEALGEWKRAERMCRACIAGRRRQGDSYADESHGYFGECEKVLPQIRMRIRWLIAHDYNHWLLYRPYDSDIQVPPHRIGHATEGGLGLG